MSSKLEGNECYQCYNAYTKGRRSRPTSSICNRHYKESPQSFATSTVTACPDRSERHRPHRGTLDTPCGDSTIGEKIRDKELSELEYDIRSHSPLQDTRNQVPTPSLPTRTSRTQTQGASAAVSAHSGSETGHKRQVMLACSSREATQGGTQLTDRPAAPGGPDRPSQRRRSPGSTAHLARLRHQLPSESLISLTPLGHPLPPRQLPSYQRLISGSEDSTQTPPYSHWPQQPSAWASQQPVLSAGSSNPLHPAPPWPVRNSNSALPLASSGGTQPADSQGSNILPWEHDGRTSPAQHPQRERAGAYVSGPSLRLPGFRSPPLDPDRAREAADRAFEARQKFRRQRGDI